MDIEFSIDRLGNRRQQFRTFPTATQNALLDIEDHRGGPPEIAGFGSEPTFPDFVIQGLAPQLISSFFEYFHRNVEPRTMFTRSDRLPGRSLKK